MDTLTRDHRSFMIRCLVDIAEEIKTSYPIEANSLQNMAATLRVEEERRNKCPL